MTHVRQFARLTLISLHLVLLNICLAIWFSIYFVFESVKDESVGAVAVCTLTVPDEDAAERDGLERSSLSQSGSYQLMMKVMNGNQQPLERDQLRRLNTNQDQESSSSSSMTSHLDSQSSPIELTLAVMSLCPDALYCQSTLDQVFNKDGSIHEKVKLNPIYISHPSKDGIECKHGQRECQGNIHQLCLWNHLNPTVDSHHPQDDPAPLSSSYFDQSSRSRNQTIWWDYLRCIDAKGLDKIGEQASTIECLEGIVDGPRWKEDGIEHCSRGQLGRDLLRMSSKQVEDRGITNSCTIDLPNQPRCVYDSGEWKGCTFGTRPEDFINVIQEEWIKRNQNHLDSSGSMISNLQSNDWTPTQSRPTQIVLAKRQGSGSSSPSTPSTIPPPAQTSDSNDNGRPTTPLSVFQRPFRFDGDLVALWNTELPSLPLDRNRNDFSTPKLYKRQSLTESISSSPSSTVPPSSTPTATPNNDNDSPGFPIPFLAFAIAAIALFVLVVAFVLLRIFVRNRRLRRLGLYPDGPIDRLLGNVREIEDTLPPPKLWEAKIEDVRRGGSSNGNGKGGGGYLDEKNGNGLMNMGIKGWDSLMPVSAALPPSLYPILVPESSNPNPATTATIGASSYPPPTNAYSDVHSHYTGGRNILTRRIPAFLRRGGGEGDSSTNPSVPTSDSQKDKSKAEGGTSSNQDSESSVKPEDLMNASVNITVLIAMPSPTTVFPSSLSSRNPQRKNLPNATSTTSLRSPASIQTFASAVAGINVLEDDKGKARRAPSVRTAASGKSLAEARREAFFAAENLEEPQPDQAQALPRNSQDDDRKETYDLNDDDEEELPELVFGTASVPLFRKVYNDGLQSQYPTGLNNNNNGIAGPSRMASIPMSISLSSPNSTDLNHPSKSDLVNLLNLAQLGREAKTKRTEALKEAEEKKQNEENLEGNLSQDVGDRSGISFSNNDHTNNNALTSIAISNDQSSNNHLGSNPVVQRMLALNNVNDSNSDQLVDGSRPSLAQSGYTFSSENERETERNLAPTPNTIDPLVNYNDVNTPSRRSESPDQVQTPRRSLNQQRIPEPA